MGYFERGRHDGKWENARGRDRTRIHEPEGVMETVEQTRSALDLVSLLEARNGRLLANMSTEPDAQLLAELENFACMRELDEVPSEGFHLYLGPGSEQTAAIAELYGTSLCAGYILTDYAAEMARSISLFRPDLAVDAGLSGIKSVPPDDGTASRVEMPDGHFMFAGGPAARDEDIAGYYGRRVRLPGAGPMARRFEPSAALSGLLQPGDRPLAVVWSDGTEADAFLPSLEFLGDSGYRIVHAGRSACPHSFERLDVVNYAESGLADFKNDLTLFSNAEICLFGNARQSVVAGVLDKPCVVANLRELTRPPVSNVCVYTVSRAKDRETGDFVPFGAQMERGALENPSAPAGNHEYVDCDAADIREALVEALALTQSAKELSRDQQAYRDLASRYPCSNLAASRIGAVFIERCRDLL